MRAGSIRPASALMLAPALLLTLIPLNGALAAPKPPPDQIINIVVYGDDPCPKAEGDEIVVCGRRPEADRYRIPKELRVKKNDDLSEMGWGAAVASLDDAQRFTRPDSCSPFGSGGQTGCIQQMMREWFADRRAQKAAE